MLAPVAWAPVLAPVAWAPVLARVAWALVLAPVAWASALAPVTWASALALVVPAPQRWEEVPGWEEVLEQRQVVLTNLLTGWVSPRMECHFAHSLYQYRYQERHPFEPVHVKLQCS